MFKQALILAGGKGTRLRPLTYAVPKPLLPVGDKPIIEDIILKLKKFGIAKIYISVNYKKELIMNYLKKGELLGVEIKYLEEDSPTGTAGSLLYIPTMEDTVVINGDIYTDIDYKGLYQFMINADYDFVIVAVKQVYRIDFGVINFEKENGKLIDWEEKPDYVYYINGGIYGLRGKVLSFLRGNITSKKIDMPKVWEILANNGDKIGVYVHEGLWKDIGKINEYLKFLEVE